jgi:hypothetical protein
MVGLPARGKSYTAQKLARYLSWLGYPTRLFNLGELRRVVFGAHLPASFFDPENTRGRGALDDLARTALEELTKWLNSGGRIAIFDATNSNRNRRAWIRDHCERAGFHVQFIELVNDDPAAVDENIRATKLSSPDYAGMDPDEAVRDFRARIAHYESQYQTLIDGEGSYVKLIDRGRQVVMNRIDGYVPARIVFFLTNLQISLRPIWLTRHGESLFNLVNRIGGDPPLSPRGEEYGRRLAEHAKHHFGPDDELEVWTSTLRRTIETARFLGVEISQWRSLDEIDAGVCDGMTYAEIEEQMPREFQAALSLPAGRVLPGRDPASRSRDYRVGAPPHAGLGDRPSSCAPGPVRLLCRPPPGALSPRVCPAKHGASAHPHCVRL